MCSNVPLICEQELSAELQRPPPSASESLPRCGGRHAAADITPRHKTKPHFSTFAFTTTPVHKHSTLRTLCQKWLTAARLMFASGWCVTQNLRLQSQDTESVDHVSADIFQHFLEPFHEKQINHHHLFSAEENESHIIISAGSAMTLQMVSV